MWVGRRAGSVMLPSLGGHTHYQTSASQPLVVSYVTSSWCQVCYQPLVVSCVASYDTEPLPHTTLTLLGGGKGEGGQLCYHILGVSYVTQHLPRMT